MINEDVILAMMFPLFELSRLLSFDGSSQLLRSAWKEVGEKSFLALHFSNGMLLSTDDTSAS